jgi:leucyl/phenylalanyl-tRNA--protein transferase
MTFLVGRIFLLHTMVIERFPEVTDADEHGLLAFGGDLDLESLILAYSSGIFPWPYDENTLAWFAPPQRAVILLDEFHVASRLARRLKQHPFELKMDTNFREVMTKCAELKNRGTQSGTWITQGLIEAYCTLFDAGFCHSFEAYKDGVLVGGLYGVQLGSYFAAESSFFRVTSASKAAMCHAADYLRRSGITWFDCQVLTPFSESFGARELSRAEFMTMLDDTLMRSLSPES